MLLALSEPHATALLLAVLGLLVALSVLLARPVDRLGIPIVLLFLALGMLGGSEGIGQIAFADYHLAVRVGTIYLVLILFDGGMNTTLGAIRRVLFPATTLATIGVALTAFLIALFARFLGLSWSQAALIGAVVSSTDAAAVLAVLRGGRLNLQPRVGQTLEVESCVNDPMAVILTMAMIQIVQGTEPFSWGLLAAVPGQLLLGTIVGTALGYLGGLLLRRVPPPIAGLYPALTLAMAFVSFGAATLVGGSGFLAVFATGLILGNTNLPYRSALTRTHEVLAWFSQIGIFLMLGLLVFPSQLVLVADKGLSLGLFLTFVARPLAVLLCLLPFGFRAREVGYIGWVGLRGAVPVILASFPMLAQVPGAEEIFNMVFFIVVLSTILPGATIRPITRWLHLAVRAKPTPSAVLEINSAFPLGGEIVSFFIEPHLAVCGARLSEIEFPQESSIVLIVRGEDLVAARGTTALMPDDHVYVFSRAADLPYIKLLFGEPERS